MRTYPFPLAAVLALLIACSSQTAEKHRPAQGNQNQPKKVWTSDDMDQLRARSDLHRQPELSCHEINDGNSCVRHWNSLFLRPQGSRTISLSGHACALRRISSSASNRVARVTA
jgi:hypothetical protein